MFVDASAIIAIIARESDADALETRLRKAPKVYVSPIVEYETTLGLARIGRVPVADAKAMLLRFLRELRAERISVTAECGARAIAAFERYGKGRHPAALNMGDCFAYACAQDLGVPLLFKGDDFALTDIAIA